MLETWKKIGEILIDTSGLSREDLEKALQRQREKGGLIGQHLLELKLIESRDLYSALALQLSLPFLDSIDYEHIDLELVAKVPINIAKRHLILPIGSDNERIKVVTANPLNIEMIDSLSILLNARLSIYVAEPSTVISAINHAYDMLSSEAEKVMDDIEDNVIDDFAEELSEPMDLLDASDEAPIIRFVNSLFSQAIKQRASDIHIEPFERDLVVRYRIDGVLYEILRPPKRLHNSIISRIKVMARLNIAEKRLPQDGRIRIKIAGKDVDVRVSVIPTSYGERVVMRLLDRSEILLDLEDLGLSKKDYEILSRLIKLSHGIILVTGPTGCGKTTTLYACLNKINRPDINILTVEDPVEYQLEGIGQLEVQPKIGLSFANALRSFLRQDPDVILVGEIRDLETAEIAIQASLTGHLVFSTLHTNDAAGAITRLVDMGVENYLVASSLVAVIAQRLVRVLCDSCKVPYSPLESELRQLGIFGKDHNGTIFKAAGCKKCMNTGYKGRTGIYEILLMNEDIKDMILKNESAGRIKSCAIKSGMRTLRSDGADKVLKGITTIEEVLRVTQEDAL